MVRGRKNQNATSAASDTVINVKINANNEIESLEVDDSDPEEGTSNAKAQKDGEDNAQDDQVTEIKVESRTVIEHVCGGCDKIYKSLAALKRHLTICRTKTPTSKINKKITIKKQKQEKNEEDEEEEEMEEVKFQPPLKKLRQQFKEDKVETDEENDIGMETVVLNFTDDQKFCFCCDEEMESAHSGHIKCEACPKSFKSFPSINKHVELLHADCTDFPCTFCNATCPDQEILDLHLDSHRSGKPFSCMNCGKDFTRKYHLDRHLNYTSCDTSKPKSELPCQVCGKVFSRTDNLREHLRGHIGQATRRRDYQCPHCEKSFYGSSLLNIHIRTHTGEKPFPCDLCDKSFPSNGALRKHRRMHTGERPYRCEICNRCFSAKETLNRHMKIHTGDRPHICTICNKSFIQRTQLRAHLSHHTGNLEFECDQCDKSFSRKQRLEAHIKYEHENAEKFGCTLCDKAFSRKEELARHIDSHMGVKKFKCDECDQGFASAYRLESHKTSNHPKKPSKCKICAVEFEKMDQLIRHMRSDHRDILQDFVGDSAELELSGTVLNISTVNEDIEAEQAMYDEEVCAEGEEEVVLQDVQQIEYITNEQEEFEENYDAPLVFVTSEGEINEETPFENAVEVKYIVRESNNAVKIKEEKSTTVTSDKKDGVKQKFNANVEAAQKYVVKKAKEWQEKMKKDKLKQDKEEMKRELAAKKLEKANEEQVLKEKAAAAALKRKQKDIADAKQRLIEEEEARNLAQKETPTTKQKQKSQNAAMKRENTDEEDTPIFLDDNTLKKHVSELLSMLVDEETLNSFGWPSAPVEEVLSSVIEQCGQTPADYNTSSDYTTKIRENAKLLFTVVIDNNFIKTLLNNHTVDEVIVQVLKLAQSKSL